MENKNLWIIGDSFTGMWEDAWIRKVCEHFNGNDYYVSSKGSRDTQTIIDIFLIKLNFINPNDLVILFLPTPQRVRLPLLKPNLDVEHSSKYINLVDKEKHLDYFVGSKSYSPTNQYTELEPLFAELLSSKNYESDLNLSKIINSSKASINNFSEIIKSLKSFVNFKLLVFSWTDEYYTDYIIGRNEITSNLGCWQTSHDVWKETNGRYGIEGDLHWSTKTHELFANYIIKTNAEYFNQ